MCFWNEVAGLCVFGMRLLPLVCFWNEVAGLCIFGMGLLAYVFWNGVGAFVDACFSTSFEWLVFARQ